MTNHQLAFNDGDRHMSVIYDETDSFILYAVLQGYATGRFQSDVSFSYNDSRGMPVRYDWTGIDSDVAKAWMLQMVNEFGFEPPFILGRFK